MRQVALKHAVPTKNEVELRSHTTHKAQNTALEDTNMSHTIRCLVRPNGITGNVEPLTFVENLQPPFHFASARRAAILIVAAGDAVLGRPMRVDVMGTSSDCERDKNDEDEQQSWSGAFEAVSIAVHGSSIWLWPARRNARWKHKPLLSAKEGTTERFWSFRVVLTMQITGYAPSD